jgi:hypothetical protein
MLIIKTHATTIEKKSTLKNKVRKKNSKRSDRERKRKIESGSTRLLGVLYCLLAVAYGLQSLTRSPLVHSANPFN